jgi:pyruvate dehydrogenase E2 component (dihydrolipoyllysine-residue acetyltransferase)
VDEELADPQPITFTPMREAIARRMVASKQQAPHFYVEIEVEMDRALATLKRVSDESGKRLTLTALLARANTLALMEQPRLNSVWRDNGLIQMKHVNLGIAIALDDGLIAPALMHVDTLTLEQTAQALEDLVARARARKLRPSEFSDATFTLSNLGGFGVSRFTAIIAPPQTAILATGRVIDRVVLADGAPVSRSFLIATVSADHRALDGADVAAFLGTFRDVLESPEKLLG